MSLRLLAAQADQAAMDAAEAAQAKADEAVRMIRNRDPKLNQASEQAATAASQYDTLAELAAAYEQALGASLEDRRNLHLQIGTLAQRLDEVQTTPGPAGKDGRDGRDGVDGVGIKGDKGDAGPAGTANLAIGLRPVGLLALNAQVDVTVPLSQPMPTTTYTVRSAHSAVVNVGDAMLTVKARTTTSVTVTVRAGVALVAGTLLVVAL